MLGQNDNEQKYTRLYLTKFQKELDKAGITDDVESFINIAFYKELETRKRQ